MNFSAGLSLALSVFVFGGCDGGIEGGACAGGACTDLADDAATGLVPCDFPLTIEMGESTYSWWPVASFVYDFDQDLCHVSTGYFTNPAYHEDANARQIALYLGYDTQDDVPHGGDVSYHEEWHSPYNSLGAGHCYSHNICEIPADEDVVVFLASDDYWDYQPALAWVDLRFEPDAGQVIINGFGAESHEKP